MRKKATDEARGDTPHESIYQQVTANIIADLERGIFPWVQPWGRGDNGASLGLPCNAASAKAYSGINVLILWGRLFEDGFTSQNWLTFRQAKNLGGTVRKGEKGTTVCYADTFVPKSEREKGDKNSDSTELQAVPFLRRYTVFNVEQCEGLPAHCLAGSSPIPERQIVPEAEALAQTTLADIRIGGMRAFYRLDGDTIHVPPQPAFFDQINYYRTLFHELAHWTGHPHRLARDLSGAFGSNNYAREELVAEIATAFLCASLHIVPTVRHADYIGSWLNVLREDSRAIFRAAREATKAADYILTFRKPAESPRTTITDEDGG